MNILFLTIGRMASVEDHSLYPDLLRFFRNSGHSIYTVSPYEKRTGLKTDIKEETGVSMLHVSIGNITKCSMIEKGISTLRIEQQFLSAIKEFFEQVKFDLVLYSTPPITFASVIKYIKRRDGARSYLLLKDIFPQNAVDIGIMTKKGPKGLLYRYFRRKEKKLYAISDRIGCMSQANVDYLLENNPEISPKKVGICPNSIEIRDMSITDEESFAIREKYGIPHDKKIFVYGGNLGRPQGIPFIIECLKAQKSNPDAYFLIVGDGTEYGKLDAFFNEENPSNMKLMNRLPKDDYDRMIAACDVGLIFLDHRFTIPNFPSRLLSYMQAGLPVLACTDTCTDIGKAIVNGGFGWWCESNDVAAFGKAVEAALASNDSQMRDREIAYLKENYTVERAYKTIINSFEGK